MKTKLIAHVQSFNGPRTIVVEHLWCVDGMPERVYGGGYKFKYDEEPFILEKKMHKNCTPELPTILMENEECTAFHVGDHVIKDSGDYTFQGVVVAAFRKLSQQVRYVVEDKRGLLFIFNAKQLKRDTDV